MMKVTQEDKLLAAVSYLWIVSVVIMIIKKDSKFIQFHAKQGFVIFIASIIFLFIPFLGWLLNLLIVILVILGFIKALSGEYWKIPVVYSIANKIKF